MSLSCFAISCTSSKKLIPNSQNVRTILNKRQKKTCTFDKSSTKNLDKMLGELIPKTVGTRYSFSFLETSLSEALIELSVESQTPIVFGEEVSSLITLNIVSKTFEEALSMIAKAGPYDYKKYDSYYYVGVLDPSEESWSKLIYEYTYKLKNIKPSVLKNSMPKPLAGLVFHNEYSNTVHIQAPRYKAIQILKFIRESDAKKAQIRIRLTIIELNRTGSNFVGKIFQSGTLFDYEPASLSLTVPTLINGTNYLKFLYTISALKEKGHAQIKATPTLLTMEQHPAKFESLKKNLLVIGGSSLTARPEFIESGVLFQITPYLVNNNTIRLSIKDSHSSTYDPDTQLLNKHKINTEVEVKEGDSVLLGGMIYDKKEKILTKVPVLNQIPLVGAFFKSKQDMTESREILFSIRPEIYCN